MIVGKTMNPNGKDSRSGVDKHRQAVLVVSLIEKGGRLVWASSAPNEKGGFIGKSVFDTVPDEEHEKLREMLTQCLLQGETVEYNIRGRASVIDPDSPVVNWHVKMWPVQPADLHTSALVLAHQIPGVVEKVTNDDREVLRLLSEDYTLRMLAKALSLSGSAIDSRIRKLKRKLGVKTIGGLVARAYALFIIPF